MLIEYLIGFMTSAISAGGYLGIFVLMALESMIAPVPSEVVMPFAGFLVAGSRFSAPLVILVSSLGSIVGSIISYYIGLYGGREAVMRFGKYLLLEESHLVWTENWFKMYGEKTIFISRFIPVVRHLISIPAGIGEMSMKKFAAYTLLGATLWNTFLLYVGIKLKDNWSVVSGYSEKIDIVAAAIIIIFAGLFIAQRMKNR